MRAFRRIIVLVLLALLLTSLITAVIIQQSRAPDEVAADAPLQLPSPPELDPALISDLLPRDAIPAIDEPVFERAADAAVHLPPNERIIGVVINGDARAYPIPILSNHEIVNDTIGGEPVAVTWCPLCYTALVFSRRLPQRAEPLTFGVSGKLLQNTLVMFDRETESLWSQLYGGAVDGPLTGTPLAIFPSQHTEWSAWLETHPDTRVLSKSDTCAQFSCGTYATNPGGSYVVDPYAGYYNMPDEGVVNRQIPRDAGAPQVKKRLLGVRIGEQARAYPYRVLREAGVINDLFNGVPIVIWFDETTQSGNAFRREVAGEILTFTAVPGDSRQLRDSESGSQWEALTGLAIDGPHRGSRLTPLIATAAFEFGWYGYFPQSDTYGSE